MGSGTSPNDLFLWHLSLTHSGSNILRTPWTDHVTLYLCAADTKQPEKPLNMNFLQGRSQDWYEGGGGGSKRCKCKCRGHALWNFPCYHVIARVGVGVGGSGQPPNPLNTPLLCLRTGGRGEVGGGTICVLALFGLMDWCVDQSHYTWDHFKETLLSKEARGCGPQSQRPIQSIPWRGHVIIEDPLGKSSGL